MSLSHHNLHFLSVLWKLTQLFLYRLYFSLFTKVFKIKNSSKPEAVVSLTPWSKSKNNGRKSAYVFVTEFSQLLSVLTTHNTTYWAVPVESLAKEVFGIPVLQLLKVRLNGLNKFMGVSSRRNEAENSSKYFYKNEQSNIYYTLYD